MTGVKVPFAAAFKTKLTTFGIQMLLDKVKRNTVFQSWGIGSSAQDETVDAQCDVLQTTLLPLFGCASYVLTVEPNYQLRIKKRPSVGAELSFVVTLSVVLFTLVGLLKLLYNKIRRGYVKPFLQQRRTSKANANTDSELNEI